MTRRRLTIRASHLLRSTVMAVAVLGCRTPGGAPDPITACEPIGSARPVCTFQNPEDLVALPGGRALLVSEYPHPGGAGGLALYVLATDERRVLFRGGDASGAPAAGWGDPGCPAPPSPAFGPHGIDLARRADGRLALAVVQHGGREAIELFEVLGSGADWRVEWRGCVLAPGRLNDVVLLSDGGLLATQMMSLAAQGPGDPEDVGFALRWSPERGIEQVPGSEMRLPNGLEVSADESTLFLNSTLGEGLRRIDLGSGEITGRIELAPLDNSTWAPDGRLLIAQLFAEETQEFIACQGLREGACPIAFQIVAVDPETLETEVRFDSAGSPMGGGTVGLQLGDELFIGSFAGDRLLRVDLSASR